MIDASDVMLMVGTLILAGAAYLGLGLAAALGIVGGVLVVAGIMRGIAGADMERFRRRVR